MPQHTEADTKAEIDRILSEVNHHALAIGDAVHRVLRESMLRGWDPDVVKGKLVPFAETVARLAGQARFEPGGNGTYNICEHCGHPWIKASEHSVCVYCAGYDAGRTAKSQAIILENKKMLEVLALCKHVREDLASLQPQDIENVLGLLSPTTKEVLKQLIVKIDDLP